MSNLKSYFDQIRDLYPNASEHDIKTIGNKTFKAVSNYLRNNNLAHDDIDTGISVANESMSIDAALGGSSSNGINGLVDLVRSCGIKQDNVRPCVESILNIMDRCLKHSTTSSWSAQNAKADHTADHGLVRGLDTLYSSDVAASMNIAAPGTEAFGVNVDAAVPDMKVAITVAIMNFHTRLVPRMFPTRTTNQPNIAYTKEYLEAYDLTSTDGERARLVDLYEDPTFVRNELKPIEPLKSNDTTGKAVVEIANKGYLTFGNKANIIKLSLDATKYGYGTANRTDIIAEGVTLASVFVTLTKDSVSEVFQLSVPISNNRLTRVINGADSALRNADLKFRVGITKDYKPVGYTETQSSTILAAMGTNDILYFDLNVKPSISLKYGDVDCLGAVSLVAGAKSGSDVTDGVKGIVTNGTVTLKAYELDARFSEENLRKTSIAIWSHRQPFSYDIPIGRNYVFDYAIGQTNAEENATNLTKIIGIGQDRVALNITERTLKDIRDRLDVVGIQPANKEDYVGLNYVAGDKIRPTVFSGTLDFSQLNIIRDADRSGDIIQKAISFLTAATSKVVQESYIQQQIGGSTIVSFRGITSMEVIGNVLGQPHIHDHLNCKQDTRDVGDGIEYRMVLPNGVRIDLITSTFKDMRNKILMWPIIDNNAESELNFAHNWDYGTMVAHYTVSGEAAFYRMFANIRELPIVLNPMGFIIDITGMDIVNGIAEDTVMRPVIGITTPAGESAVQIDGTILAGSTITTTVSGGTINTNAINS